MSLSLPAFPLSLTQSISAECELIEFSEEGNSSFSNEDAILLSMLAGQIQSEHSDAIDFRPDSEIESLNRARASCLARLDDVNEAHASRQETLTLIANMKTHLIQEHLESVPVMHEKADPEYYSETDFEDLSDNSYSVLAREFLQDFSPDGPLVADSSASRLDELQCRSEKLAGELTDEISTVSAQRMHVHLETLASGKRVETFENGSIICKDDLGRVIEIFSNFGDSLFISYGAAGELATFTRTDPAGAVHSTGKKSKDAVTVRDADGRVKAIGESMTVDPWGCFYLHTKDGQYFCLDLVGGIHSERRRVINANGEVEYITSAFAHDGFRMATLYARPRLLELGSESPMGRSARYTTYRFYGRDGTAIEFCTDDHFRSLSPSRSLPPASFPVNSSWMTARQAHTAWESVKEYLSRVS